MSEIYKKLLKVQEEIKPIEKGETNPFFRSKYFDINALLAEVKPILTKHGLFLSQPLGIQDGKNVLRTIVGDTETGEKLLESEIFLPPIDDPQKLGSAITYFRRYSIQSLLALEAIDDDAESVLRPKIDYTQKKNLTPDQYGYDPKKDPLLKKEPKHRDVAKDSAEHDTLELINQDLN